MPTRPCHPLLRPLEQRVELRGRAGWTAAGLRGAPLSAILPGGQRLGATVESVEGDIDQPMAPVVVCAKLHRYLAPGCPPRLLEAALALLERADDARPGLALREAMAA